MFAIRPSQSLLLVVGFTLMSTVVIAQVHQHDESFDTLDACDTDSTTAWWDTETGELKLTAFELNIVGEWDSPGTAYGVARDGHLAFLADGGAGLQILDILDPANPVLLGNLDTPGSAWGVVVDGTAAYVTDYTGHLQVIDVDDPANPVLLGSAAADQPLMRAAVAGDRLYAAAREAGLAVIDVSDPANPTVLAYGDTPGTAFGVALAGNHAYVADGQDGLRVVDITDPSAPTLVGGLATSSIVYGVSVQGDLVCVTDLVDGLVTVDVSDPANPARLGELSLPATGWNVQLDGAVAHVSCADGMQIIDVSDPAAPELLAEIDTPGSARGATVFGRHLLVADYTGGLQVLAARVSRDIPVLASTLTTPGTAVNLAVDGDLACVADGSAGLQLVDVGNPLQPQILSSLDEEMVATRVLMDGNHVGVIDAGQNLMIVDITDPADPTPAGVCTPGGESRDLALAGDVLYVAAMTAGLVAVDIADPAAPVIAGGLATPGSAHALALAGDLAYVADGDGGLSVLDVSDPTMPALLASAAAPGTARDVVVSGDMAYLAADDGGLHAMDVVDPTAPALAATLPLAGEALGLALAGDLLFVAAGSGGIQVVDLETPDAPVLLSTYPAPGDVCRDVVVQGDHLYAAFESAGLVLCEAFTRAFQTGPNRARSLSLNDTELPVQRVRLTTVQSDSILWEVSTSPEDTTYVATPADGIWQPVTSGTHLTWQAHLFATQPGNGPVCEDLALAWLYDTAVIDSIVDAPDDQSGLVRLDFTRSGFDFDDELESPVASYGIWRRNDDDAAPNGQTELPPGNWDFLTTIAAAQQDTYQVTVATAQDSVVAAYCVTTHVAGSAVWYCSPPDSASSFDDLAPTVPTGLQLVTPELLTWDDAVDEDFDLFSVYGSATAEIADAVLIDETVESELAVSGSDHDYYLVTASDTVGNESEPAVLQVHQVGSPDGPPARLALGPATPNPFNPSTTLSFATPASGHVRLQVIDLGGRLVATLVDRVVTAGRHTVVWDGRDAAGREVPSGVYLSRIEAGDAVARGRMTLVR